MTTTVYEVRGKHAIPKLQPRPKTADETTPPKIRNWFVAYTLYDARTHDEIGQGSKTFLSSSNGGKLIGEITEFVKAGRPDTVILNCVTCID